MSAQRSFSNSDQLRLSAVSHSYDLFYSDVNSQITSTYLEVLHIPKWSKSLNSCS